MKRIVFEEKKTKKKGSFGTKRVTFHRVGKQRAKMHGGGDNELMIMYCTHAHLPYGHSAFDLLGFRQLLQSSPFIPSAYALLSFHPRLT
jgi:hypothetical protein